VLLGAPMPAAAQLGPWYGLLLRLPEVLFDAPLGEEWGWRGYPLPLLPAGGSALASSLVLGVLVAAWHLPVALDAPALAPYLVGTVASAIVANWVYYNTRGSALLVIQYHTIQNAVGGWFLYSIFAGAVLARLWWLWGAVYCAAAVGIVLVTGPTLCRKAAPLARPTSPGGRPTSRRPATSPARSATRQPVRCSGGSSTWAAWPRCTLRWASGSCTDSRAAGAAQLDPPPMLAVAASGQRRDGHQAEASERSTYGFRAQRCAATPTWAHMSSRGQVEQRGIDPVQMCLPKGTRRRLISSQ
jgi:hypothetical protein